MRMIFTGGKGALHAQLRQNNEGELVAETPGVMSGFVWKGKGLRVAISWVGFEGGGIVWELCLHGRHTIFPPITYLFGVALGAGHWNL